MLLRDRRVTFNNDFLSKGMEHLSAAAPTRLGTYVTRTVAGVELTLLDCVRYFRKAAGIDGVAQIVKDIGAKANPRLLQSAAAAYENSAVRRLGYLLEWTGHLRQADALQVFVARAKTALPLDPSFRPLMVADAQHGERNARWKLVIDDAVEVAE